MEYQSKYSEAQMLIRKPVHEVFEAMANPEITTNFWFTKSSGRLETGKSIIWKWEMYGVSATIKVIEMVPNEKIVFEWQQPARTVEFKFQKIDDTTTYCIAKESGYTETGDDLLKVIRDSTGGFTTVLDGLKAYLEYNIRLNLVGDKFLTK